MVSIVWFRRDLRLCDNPALLTAAKRGPVLPVFILDPADPPGGAARWWLSRSLRALAKSLGFLWVAKGDPAEILPSLVEAVDAEAVYWNRIWEPDRAGRDMLVARALKLSHMAAVSFDTGVLLTPDKVMTKSGTPFRVFTPFWKNYQSTDIPAPEGACSPDVMLCSGSESLEQLGLLPEPHWASGWDQIWTPGEAGALSRLQTFLDERVANYPERRDFPATDGVSKLSPHIHWGEISPRMLWSAVRAHQHIHEEILGTPASGSASGGDAFLRQIAWRDFAIYLLWHSPAMTRENWNPQFDRFTWRENAADLERWQKGQTGFPLVDAGMRQLWQTGWMHNRVRMVVASFLTKDLRIHWREGAKWFSDTLLDADAAVNAASWQWVAGCGADAAPYFRIFNPASQSARFDPAGDYIRRWCPELAHLSASQIHDPVAELRQGYPPPMVDHAAARQAALSAYGAIKV